MNWFLIFLFCLLVIQTIVADGCLQVERDALLEFKARVTDPFGRLVSWRGDECCKWTGIKCSNQTGHVIKLNLTSHSQSHPYYSDEEPWYNNSLCGEISPSLHALTDLKHLDLSYNNFTGRMIPPQLRNLSRLQHLGLENSFIGEISDVYLNGLSKLEYLSFSPITITIDSNWVPPFELKYLDVGACKLRPTFPSWLHNQFELNFLNLSNSGIYDSMPNWFWNLSSLTNIDLSYNQIRGRLPLRLEHFTELCTIILSNNQFYGAIP
ncbi:hypothetical protein LUZ60_009870 [Juncus effusus]|nr:hypothetical protein LUZ60_009870 [Juncus effusus]